METMIKPPKSPVFEPLDNHLSAESARCRIVSHEWIKVLPLLTIFILNSIQNNDQMLIFHANTTHKPTQSSNTIAVDRSITKCFVDSSIHTKSNAELQHSFEIQQL